MTQEELAQKINVSSKAVSKWETGRGFPDIGLLEILAKALDVSVIELLSGANIQNKNRAADMRKCRFYVCPVCANVIQATGEAVVSCCGITLPPLEAEEPDEDHKIYVERQDGEYYGEVSLHFLHCGSIRQRGAVCETLPGANSRGLFQDR